MWTYLGIIVSGEEFTAPQTHLQVGDISIGNDLPLGRDRMPRPAERPVHARELRAGSPMYVRPQRRCRRHGMALRSDICKSDFGDELRCAFIRMQTRRDMPSGMSHMLGIAHAASHRCGLMVK